MVRHHLGPVPFLASIWNERCLCEDLFYEDEGVGCAKEQKLEVSMALAVLVLFLAIVVPPIVLIRGKLDATSKAIR